MVEINQIADKESLRNWLLALPYDDDENTRIAVTIAHRAAMRVLPNYWQGASELDLRLIFVLWANLVSGIAGSCPTPSIKSASAAATAASTKASAAANHAAYLVADSKHASVRVYTDYANAVSAKYSSLTTAAHFATLAAGVAVEYSVRFDAQGLQWLEIQRDAAAFTKKNVTLDSTPLYSETNPFGPTWEHLKNYMPESLHFWRDWYQDALDGVLPNWNMLTEIALIDPKDWKNKDPDHMNRSISGVVEKHGRLGDTRD